MSSADMLRDRIMTPDGAYEVRAVLPFGHVAVARATGWGGCGTGSVSFARLTLRYALAYAHAANLPHPRASGFEN
eukprot:787777-Prorocentrum_minimum.AAC.1